jgi:hypothetical protein
MPAISVGTTAVSLPAGSNGRLLIQNRGTASVFFTVDTDATVDGGIELLPNAVYEFPVIASSDSEVSLISTAAGQDVRWLEVGSQL